VCTLQKFKPPKEILVKKLLYITKEIITKK